MRDGFCRWFPAVLIIGLWSAAPAAAQDAAVTALERRMEHLETRMGVLEGYLDELAPRLNSFSSELYKSVDQRLELATGQVAALSPISRKFTKIQTNAGTFLLAIADTEKLANGYRLTLKIGNPNAAVYSGARFKDFLGPGLGSQETWRPTYVEEWRQSLAGAEFSYKGDLVPGVWTQVIVDLVPATASQFEYIECQMEVDGVQLAASANVFVARSGRGVALIFYYQGERAPAMATRHPR